MKYAIVDIETTGSNSGQNRLTEIAIYIHDGVKITDEFCSLINPECRIPPFISRLTGITDEMVSTAPRFCEVAKQIVQITEGAVFVAHNAAFDYNFIRNEFKSLGYDYNRDSLCTIRLSRKLIPGHRSYGLGNLCKNLNIKIQDRHRASGDALATVKLFELLIQKNKSPEGFYEFLKNDYVHLRFPPHFNRNIINSIPESTGIYYLHDENGNVIYIGKSNNIRNRVISHFRNKQNRRSVEMRNSIHSISYEETGNELIALLLESEEIKKLQPFYNRAQKFTNYNHSIYTKENIKGYIEFEILKKKTNREAVFTARSDDHAASILEILIDKFHLCRKLCGLNDITHACYGYSIGRCHGACIGKESSFDYNKRVFKAIESLQYENPSFMIIGNGRTISEKSIVRIEQGKYIGFGFFDTQDTDFSPETLKDIVSVKNDNKDVHRIIRQYLRSENKHQIIVC